MGEVGLQVAPEEPRTPSPEGDLNGISADPGFVRDFISDKPVRATPEEVEAVQIFARRLVQEFGYPKDFIQTRPQFRVRARPSGGTARGYPVDIAVFATNSKAEEDLTIVVECKRKTRQDGEKQLKLYLTLCAAQIGVWFNGADHLYLLKRYLPDGTIEWTELPTIPRWGQALADIGATPRRDLRPPTSLKSVFRDIRNHLAGNTVGITRDQTFAQEIMSLLFCKIYDELETAPDAIPSWRAGIDEPTVAVVKRVDTLFDQVKRRYPDVFEGDERIELDPESVRYVVGELQNLLVIAASRDAIGEAFEVFIGPAVRGEEGQFFTPRNVVELIVELLDPKPTDKILDPACGSGGFLIVGLERVWSQLEAEAKQKVWSDVQLDRRKREVAAQNFRGIEKDGFLAKVTKAYMAIIGDGRGGIHCENTLDEPANWKPAAQSAAKLKSFDVVVTNPPFGSKIRVTGADRLKQYRLAHIWKAPRAKGEDWTMTASVMRDQSPQILFIERCAQFLKPGGRLGIILPESIFGMPKYGYVVKWLMENFTMRAFISLPDEVFQPYTHAKTCIVILENTKPSGSYPIKMAIADWCGHDSRGNPTLRRDAEGNEELLDDLPKIGARLRSEFPWSR